MDKPKLSITERKVVKAKIKAELTGVSQAQVAREVFPNQTPGSAAVYMSTELRKPNVQQALELALAEYDLTPNRLAGVVHEAMSATKTVIVRDNSAKSPEESANSAFADEIPDHSIRLKAASMAAQWMGIGKQDGGTTNINFIGVSKDDAESYAV